jgi:YidC/Oxa1 family membrane protein insertase
MAARTGSILGRKPKVDDTVDSAPKVDGRSLAPKPGARPVNPKKGKPPAKRTG